MDEQIIVLIYSLFTMCILKDRYTHASCASNTRVLKFGPTCKYMCHCKDETEQCGDVDGTCTSGCADAWMGPGCQYRDVAFKQITNHKNNIDSPEYSERAADGNLETCSRTDTSTDNPWWRFWLPQKELITGLVLITDPEVLGNFKSYKVTVEGATTKSVGRNNYTNQQTCYATSGWNPPYHIINVTCNQPFFNNQVRITLNGTTQLVICDIRVYGGKNLAFGRQTNQSTYSGSSHNAELTVNGVIGTSVDECSATQVQDQPWWSVDLKHIMRIQSIRISTDIYEGLSNFLLHAKNDSSDDWVTIHNDTDKTPPTRNITVLIQARYLRLYSTKQNVNLTICEVQVFGECSAGRWGPGCDVVCGHCLGEISCSGQTGHCSKGCEDGFKDLPTCETACDDGTYGSKCLQQCGHCKHGDACHKDNGSCPNGCSPGWRNTTCEDRCEYGWYGDTCSMECSKHCKGGYTNCNNVNGTCEQFCGAGWSGHMCKEECPPGTYGENCQNVCGHCLNDPCDSVSGNCTSGCMAGYYRTPDCVTACSNGSYGMNCEKNCSENCQDKNNCNTTSGKCDCKPGWRGELCDQACGNGKWGYNCKHACGSCLVGSCGRFTGYCSGGCQPGYLRTELCYDECAAGTYGQDCTFNCSERCFTPSDCNKTDGRCESCVTGWKGNLCEQVSELSSEQSIPVEAIAGGTVAALVAISVVLVVLLILRYRRNNEKQAQFRSRDLMDVSREESGNGNDLVDPVTVKPSTSKGDAIYINSDVFLSLRDTYAGKLGTSTSKSTSQLETAVADNGNDSEYYNTSVQRDLPKGAIWLSNLREYIGGNTSKGDIFHEQFSALPKGLKYPTTVALKPRNRPKNRYKELYAYDHTRVVLKKIPGKGDSDYINAAFINGYRMEKAYIAAQGPTKANIFDFWRMIWEKDVIKIVMVTNVVEEGKEKCEQYWNSEEPICYDSLSVTVTSEEVMAEFTIRTFSVKSIPQNTQRTITHYQFTAWPDKSIPNGHTGLVQFWSKVRMDDKESAHPWLVHCSAGVGRTGTFIALDILYDQGRQLENVNVNQCVRELRQQRVNMVQTQSQYRYLHEIVYEALVLPSLQIRLSDFENEYRKLIEVDKQTGMTCLKSQFEMQEEVVYLSKEDIDEKEHSDDVDLYTSAKLPENKVKNRYNNILASDKYRPFLSTHVPGCNDYINAVYIPSYRKLRGFIVTQAALENTAIDCCRLVHERDIHVIVTFADNGTERIGTYLPDKGSLTTGHFHLELVSEEKRRNYTIRNYNMQFKKKEQKVKQLLFTQWLREETVPRDQEAILSLIQEVTEQQRQSDNNPILVQCLNGAERSGMFVVLMNVLERMRIEQEVAIPPVIRNLRQIRQQIIPNFEQYKFCHEAVLRHIQDTSTYANV